MISLTGSVETGRWIAGHAASTLKRVHLELGGKAPVVVFDDVAMETALETNGTPDGFASSVWTRDVSRALRVSNALRFGCVWINDHIPLASEMPHGGYKQSGYGKDLSMYALEDYTQIKHVMAKLD